MWERVFARCAGCGNVYVARDDGSRLVVPTRTGACACGTSAFDRLVAAADRVAERS